MRLLVLQAERGDNRDALASLEALAPLGVELVLMRRTMHPWQWDAHRLASCVARWERVDPRDGAAVLDRALRAGALDGVLATNEECLRAAARVRAHLRLPGPSPAAVERCRDKWALRCCLRAAAVPTPEARLVRDRAQAERAVTELRLPVVLKPRDAAGSVGVVHVDRQKETAAAFELAAHARWGDARCEGVIVERALVGRALAATLLVSLGKVTLLALSEKRTCGSPFFVTFADRMLVEPALEAAVSRIVERATLAVGLEQTLVHAELIENDGDLSVLELTPRPGGGYLPEAIARHTGLSTSMIAGMVALGQSPVVRPARAPVAARALFSPRPGRLVRLEASAAPGVVVRWLKSVGDRVGAPPEDFFGAVGWAVAMGASAGDAEAGLDELERNARIEVARGVDPALARALAVRARDAALEVSSWIGAR